MQNKAIENIDSGVSRLSAARHCQVERIAINRVVDAAPSVRQEGDTVIVPVIKEIMVVEKRLLLKEEIQVRQQPIVQHVREPVVLSRSVRAMRRNA